MSDLTVYQLVAEPKSKTLWFKGAASSEWTKIDMQSFFEAVDMSEQQNSADAA